MLKNVKRELDKRHCEYSQVGSILRIRESRDGPFILVATTNHIPCVYFSVPPTFIFVYYPANQDGEREWYYDCPERAAMNIQKYVEKHYHTPCGVPGSRDVI